MAERRSLFPETLSRRVVDGRLLYAPVVTVASGRLVFVSGLLSRDAAGAIVGRGDMGAQIDQIGRNLEAALEAAGAKLSDLVRTQTFTTDINAFFREVEVRARYFRDPLPTSTTVEVRRLSNPDFLVEIEAMAVLPA